MRRLVLLAVACVLLATAVFLALRDEDEGASPGRVSLVGDSLNVGIEPYLGRALPGWELETDDVVGRSSADGVDALERRGASLAPRVVISLGTNDAAADVDGFRARVARALAVTGRSRCVVWATIYRDGDAYEVFNDVLRGEARERPRLVLVDWARIVAEAPELLAADGVHGTEAGYAARAAAVAEAVRSCEVEDGS